MQEETLNLRLLRFYRPVAVLYRETVARRKIFQPICHSETERSKAQWSEESMNFIKQLEQLYL